MTSADGSALTALSAGTVPNVAIEVRGRIIELTINRPDRRNALTARMVRGLVELLDEIAGDDTLRALLLTGAGERAFCAGFDIDEINSPGSDAVGSERDLVERLATALATLPIPVVAAVNGAAVGTGCDLALACDIRIGSRAARFGMPPVRLGILYAWPGIDRLLRAVGLSAAKEMLLTGDLIDANRAQEIGLLSKVLEADQLMAEARRLCDRLAANAPLSVRASKRSLNLLAGPKPDEGTLDELARLQALVWTSADASEGTHAHREGRQPRFEGR